MVLQVSHQLLSSERKSQLAVCVKQKNTIQIHFMYSSKYESLVISALYHGCIVTSEQL